MAITCCICGKKQSGWLNDYPLSRSIDKRVCVKCNENMMRLYNSSEEERNEAIEYISQACKNNARLEDSVKRFVEDSIERGEVETNDSLSDQFMEQEKANVESIMVTSSNSFQGFTITKYHDFISTETVIGMGALKAFIAGLSNTFGTEATVLNSKLEEARQIAMYKIRKRTYELGANAIISIDLDYTMFGDTMVAIIISGTAVSITKN